MMREPRVSVGNEAMPGPFDGSTHSNATTCPADHTDIPSEAAIIGDQQWHMCMVLVHEQSLIS
jgi:hypothetical protein